MTKIICIANQKGGVGKSTLSLSLASCFKTNLKVGIVDIDLQGSLSAMNLMADGITVVPYDKSLKWVTDHLHDIIIVDTPPYLSSILPDIFAMSDFILIPTKAGFFDLMAIKSTIALVNEARKKNSELKSGIVFNMVKHNSSISEELKNVMENESIPILKSIITERISYTRSVINGGIFNSNDDKAKNEIVSLADEIISMMGF